MKGCFHHGNHTQMINESTTAILVGYLIINRQFEVKMEINSMWTLCFIMRRHNSRKQLSYVRRKRTKMQEYNSRCLVAMLICFRHKYASIVDIIHIPRNHEETD